MDFITVIITIGCAHALFLGVLLLSLNRGNLAANKLLGILMILISVSMTGFIIIRTDLYLTFPHFIGIPSSVIFLFGPLFYFYTGALIKNRKGLPKRSYLHFLPFFLFLLYRLPFFFSDTETKIGYYSEHFFSAENITVTVIQIIHLFTYLHVVKMMQIGHEKSLKDEISSIDKINLNWISVSVNAFILIFSITGILIGFSFFGVNLYKSYITVFPIFISAIIILMGFWGLRQPIIIAPEKESHKVKKYEKSTLDEYRAGEFVEKLLLTMEQKKPHLSSDLTLKSLAEITDIPPHYLSQIINERLNKNFFDFVNGYRIEEAKRYLSEPKGELLTILAISEEAGFNSKSAFNAAFKKATGSTPSEFKSSLEGKKK